MAMPRLRLRRRQTVILAVGVVVVIGAAAYLVSGLFGSTTTTTFTVAKTYRSYDNGAKGSDGLPAFMVRTTTGRTYLVPSVSTWAVLKPGVRYECRVYEYRYGGEIRSCDLNTR